MELTQGDLQLGFGIRLTGGDVIHRFKIATLVQTPGQTVEEDWFLNLQGEYLELLR
jgi:hypothetical protein